MAEFVLDPDPRSTWGASPEYRAAWFAEYGMDFPGTVNNLSYDSLALAALAGRSNQDGSALLVSGAKMRWRREFNDVTLADWNQSAAGAGMGAWTVANGTLTATMGTTVNAEQSITSKQAFSAPFSIQMGLRLSQKIANNEVYVEVIAENADASGVDETIVAAWRLSGTDSTAATNGRVEVRNGAAARVQSGNITVASHSAADAIFEIRLESDEVWFFSKGVNSASQKSSATVYNQVAPDPTKKYRVRLRLKNGSTAPASSTTVTAYFVTAVDFTEQQVNIVGGDASGTAANAVPVAITSGATTGTPSLAASTTVTGTTIAKVLSAATVNNTLVKATAGRLYGYHLVNTAATARYVKMYNKTTAPVAGTDVPALTIPIPAGGIAVVDRSVPISFLTGIGYAITANPADNDATVVGANEVVGHLLYA